MTRPYLFNHFKMPQRFLYCFHLLCCRMLPRLFQFFYRIRGIIHWQAQTSLYLRYISSMYLEAIFSFYVFLYHFVGNSLFRLVHFYYFSNIIKRNFAFSLAKLDFHIDYTVRFFVGKQYYRLHMYIKSEHIPTKSRKYRQYLYSTNTAHASLFPQNINPINFAPP